MSPSRVGGEAVLLLGRALEVPLVAELARGLQECVPTTRAGFARQGAKEKQLLKEGNAFNVSSFVLRAMMSGQYWPEGDEVYHAELTVPVLLVHGMHDKFVPVEEDQRMAEVGPWHPSHHTPLYPLRTRPRAILPCASAQRRESLD